MADDKQLEAIRLLCGKPFSEQSKKRSDGGHARGWAYLVRQIAYFDSGKACTDDVATQVAKVLRKHFPNSSDWSDRVNAPGAHLEILTIIRDEFETRNGVSVDSSVTGS